MKIIRPPKQCIVYVTENGQVMHAMTSMIHEAGKVIHLKAKQQMAKSIGQVAKFNRRYGQMEQEENEDSKQV